MLKQLAILVAAFALIACSEESVNDQAEAVVEAVEAQVAQAVEAAEEVQESVEGDMAEAVESTEEAVEEVVEEVKEAVATGTVEG